MTAALLDRIAPAGLGALHELIDSLGSVADGCPAGGFDGLLTELDRAIRRLEAVKLRVVAAADAAQVAERTGLADTSSWLARRTRSGSAQAAAQVHLATALDASEAAPRPCADALAAGDLSTEHARVIVKATERLPDGLSAAAVTEIERDLVDRAASLSPDQLRRAARRALAVVTDDQAAVDRHEDTLLRTEEDTALAKTRLTWHDNGDGTVSGHFTVPTVAAAILTKTIQSMTAPRRARLGATLAQAGDPIARRDWAQQSGLAFVELLEHHPRKRIEPTGPSFAEERRGGAEVCPVGDHPSTPHLHRIEYGQHPPIRLGTNSCGQCRDRRGGSTRPPPLRSSGQLEPPRLTSLREGERPFSWCELHHREPWSTGGSTDLADAVPLCGFHHRRIHDPEYQHEFTPAV